MIVVNRKSYPDPCEGCEHAKKCSGCDPWRIRYRYRQKQINAYAEKKRKEYFAKRFVYQHPDKIRSYLRVWPCGNCEKEPDCEIPCSDYLRWYNARVAVAKIKLTTQRNEKR